MTTIKNITITVPSQLERMLLGTIPSEKNEDEKKQFLKEELERMLIDRIVEEIEDYNDAVEALSSWEGNITLESIEKKYNLN